MAKVYCPCGREYEVPEAHLGNRVKCGSCNRTFIAQVSEHEPDVVPATELLSPVEEVDDLDVPPTPEAPPLPQQKRKPRLGDLAVERAFVSKEHIELCAKVQQALRNAGETEKRIGDILVEKGLLKPEQLEDLLSEQFGQEREDAPRPVTPLPAPRTPKPEKRPEPKPAAEPSTSGFNPSLIFLPLAVGLLIFLIVQFWPAPAAQRTLAAYLESSGEGAIQADRALALEDLALIVREFRVQKPLPAVRHDYSPELKVFVSRKDKGAWQEMIDGVEMSQVKRQHLALVAPHLPEALTPQNADALTITVRPIDCFLLFKPKGSSFFKRGDYRFLVVRIDCPKWTSGWKVASYAPCPAPTPEARQ